MAEFQTGGDQIQIEQEITPPTAAELAQMQACIEGLGSQGGIGGGIAGGGGRAGGLGQCLPERLLRFRGSFTTPQRTIQQILNPPQTDITTEPYTIAGVDLSSGGPGLITPAQVTSGAFFHGTGSQPRGGRGRVTMELDCGDHYPSTVPFSFVFASHHGRDVVVHRTLVEAGQGDSHFRRAFRSFLLGWEQLFTSGEDGLAVWDLGTGERTANAPGFRPRRYGATAGQFVELRDQEVVSWSHKAP